MDRQIALEKFIDPQIIHRTKQHFIIQSSFSIYWPRASQTGHGGLSQRSFVVFSSVCSNFSVSIQHIQAGEDGCRTCLVARDCRIEGLEPNGVWRCLLVVLCWERNRHVIPSIRVALDEKGLPDICWGL